MAKIAYQEGGYTVAGLLARIGGILEWTVTDAAADASAKVFEAVTAAGQAACTWDGIRWDWLEETSMFQTKTLTVATAANDGARRTSNVSTIICTANCLLRAGQMVKISSCSDSTFDGTWKVVSASTTTFTFNQVGDDVGAATAGTGSVYVVSYPLRVTDVGGGVTATSASKVAWGVYAVEEVIYDDDWSLSPLPWREYRRRLRLLETTGAGKPLAWSIHQEAVTSGSGSEPMLHLWPAPDDNYNLWIDYIKRHSKITGGTSGSEDYALIVPSEFQEDIYVRGAVWLLRRDITDILSLRECPAFMDGIRRMISSQSSRYLNKNQEDLYPEARMGRLPHDRRVIMTSDGYLISEDVSI